MTVKIDLEQIRSLLAVIGSTDITELTIEQGDEKKAAKIFMSYPGFKDASGKHPVGLANDAFDAGSLLYWSGNLAEALPLYRIAHRSFNRGTAVVATWMWALVPIFIFWANCHGGYFMGWVMLGAYCGEALIQRMRKRPVEGEKQLWMVTAACFFFNCSRPPAMIEDCTHVWHARGEIRRSASKNVSGSCFKEKHCIDRGARLPCWYD